jgi:hypothetical protein
MASDAYVGRSFGSFRVFEKIGEGAMGMVYRAVHTGFERDVAFKILPDRLVEGNPEFVKRFFIEARAAGAINHPNVVTVFDAGMDGGVHYIAMEFVKGMTLREYLRKRRPLAQSETVEITLQAVAGLSAAYESRIIHRDIKPANLMFTHDEIVKIADFGLAKNLEASVQLTRSGEPMGTPAYISPEQARGRPADFRSDMYSLGVTLFEMATGKRPFSAETPWGLMRMHCEEPVPDPCDVNEAVHPKLAMVIMRMMEKEPGDRFESYGRLGAALQEVREEIEMEGAVAGSAGSERPLLAISRTVAGATTIRDAGRPILTPAEFRADRGLRKRKSRRIPRVIPGESRIVSPALVVLVALSIAFGAVLFFAGRGDPEEGEEKAKKPDKVKKAEKAGEIPEWMKEKKKIDRERARIRGFLDRAWNLEKKGEVEEALDVLSEIEKIAPKNEKLEAARRRIAGKQKEIRWKAERDRNYKNDLGAAKVFVARAVKSGKASDWALAVEAANKARKLRKTKEVNQLLHTAQGWHLWTLALEKDRAGDLDDAVILAKKALKYRLPFPSGRAYLSKLKKRIVAKDREDLRADHFERCKEKARAEEEKGSEGDAETALALWEEALKFAGSEEEKKMGQERIDALREMLDR